MLARITALLLSSSEILLFFFPRRLLTACLRRGIFILDGARTQAHLLKGAYIADQRYLWPQVHELLPIRQYIMRQGPLHHVVKTEFLFVDALSCNYLRKHRKIIRAGRFCCGTVFFFCVDLCVQWAYRFLMEPKDLRKKREELGLTQSQLAVYLNTPYETYSNWERGVRRIPGILKVALEKVASDLKK